MKNNKILGQLEICRAMEIKPNFSELARMYGMDRHTIKKYWENGGIKMKERETRSSHLDKYKEEIEELFCKPDISKIGVYYFMADKYGKDEIGSESNFRHYTLTRDLRRMERKYDLKSIPVR